MDRHPSVSSTYSTDSVRFVFGRSDTERRSPFQFRAGGAPSPQAESDQRQPSRLRDENAAAGQLHGSYTHPDIYPPPLKIPERKTGLRQVRFPSSSHPGDSDWQSPRQQPPTIVDVTGKSPSVRETKDSDTLGRAWRSQHATTNPNHRSTGSNATFNGDLRSPSSVKWSPNGDTRGTFYEENTPIDPVPNSRLQALSAAIAAGLAANPSHTSSPRIGERATPDVRMPFDEGAGSPVSTHTNFTLLSAYDRGTENGVLSPVSTLRSPNSGRHIPTRLSPLLERPPSSNSFNPLISPKLEQRAVNDRIPVDRRPPKLDINAVRDAEVRGSLTSLPDLIRRATRLASNLDRGRTASRLGLDAFMHSDRHLPPTKRESTYSDVLFSFPQPSKSTLNLPAGVSQASVDEKDASHAQRYPRPPRKRRNRQRKCCGMSVFLFITILMLIIVLIAAAILLPIFLILVPRQAQNASALRQCPTTHSCYNGGYSVVDNNACSCVCIGGYTGSQCSQAYDPTCITTTVQSGSQTYNNATIGSSVLPLLGQSSTLFNIPLNSTILLSAFSQSNFSCEGENSLVDVNVTSSSKVKRVYNMPDILMPRNVPTPTSADELKEPDRRTASKTMSQTPSTAAAIISSSSSGFSITSDTSSLTTSAVSPTSTTSSPLSHAQIVFGQVAILYVLTETRNSVLAINAQQIITQYLENGGPSNGNSTVELVSGDNNIVANFGIFAITTNDGTSSVGSGSGSGSGS